MAGELGSYNDFLNDRGLEHGPEAIEAYSFALQSFRAALAEIRGIRVEDLHDIPNVIVHNQDAA